MSYDTTPDPAFLRAIQNQDWTVGGATAELVDNGFGKGRGNASRVEVMYHTRTRCLTVLDNGRGMGEVGQLFKLGDTIGRTPGDIGEYGCGGTWALLWLSAKVDIWTLRKGKVNLDTVNWPDAIKARKYPQVSDRWLKATPKNTPPMLLSLRHGTLIQVHLMDKRDFRIDNVQRDLAALYAPAIRHGKTLVWKTDGRDEIALADPLEMPEDKDKWWWGDITVSHLDKKLKAECKVGLIEDLPAARSRVAIGFGSRVITRTRDCYGNRDGSVVYAGTGMGGYIDLEDGWQPYLTTTKNGIDDKVLWKTLMEAVFEEIEPLLKEVQERELYVELADWAFAMEEAVNGKFKIIVSKSKNPMPPDIEWGEPNDPPIPRKKRNTPGDKPGDGTKPARSRIMVQLLSDKDMAQVLCRAEQCQQGILVQLNQDHEVVKHALKRRDHSFNIMTIREVANVIVNDEDTLRKVFGPPWFGEIEERRNNGGGHEQYVARLLIDSVVEAE